MSDASAINQMILSRMEEFCSFILPNGKRIGNKWVVGSSDGEQGKSFQVTVSGSKAGMFKDFAGDDKGGTPLWLLSQVRKIPFSQAVKEAADWLGIKADDYGVKRHKPKSYAKPEKITSRQAEPNTKVMDYLTIERKIDPRVVSEAKISETEDGESIIFNYADYDESAEKWMVAHRKFLDVDRPDGKKKMWATKDTKPCLYGKQMVGDDVRELVVSEGEIDQLSWLSWSIPAVSVPMGAKNLQWIDIDWEWLARFEKIYIALDQDEVGIQAAQDVCKRLGIHRCYIVTLPKKDANECLQQGLHRDKMLEVLASAKAIELDEIKRPSDFRQEVHDLYDVDPSKLGLETPWSPDLPWRIRKAELTILTGFSGHGKTIGLNQLMIHCHANDLKILDASLEVRTGMTLYNMTRTALGKRKSNKEERDACISWLEEGMFFLDCVGTVNVDRLMQAMEYARKRHGVDVFVIDSLFKCGLSGEDYAGARAFVDRLTTFCNNTGAHVILVAHSRKTANGNELSAPSKSDVAGSSDITNAAFNVIVVWRNKIKKRKLDEAKQTGNMEEYAKWEKEPDGKLILDKQRFGEGEECEIPIWFDRDAMQFHVTEGRSRPYFVMDGAELQ